jgi:hypothetical protein
MTSADTSRAWLAETAGITRAGADAPLHLALGADAVEAIRAAQERRRADLEAWEEVSRDTDLDEVRA